MKADGLTKALKGAEFMSFRAEVVNLTDWVNWWMLCYGAMLQENVFTESARKIYVVPDLVVYL